MYDLVVVGTGFASTFFLKKYLSKAPTSAKVLVLERGHFFPHAERLKQARGEHTSFGELNTHYTNTFINKTPEKHWMFQAAFGEVPTAGMAVPPGFSPQISG